MTKMEDVCLPRLMKVDPMRIAHVVSDIRWRRSPLRVGVGMHLVPTYGEQGARCSFEAMLRISGRHIDYRSTTHFSSRTYVLVARESRPFLPSS